MKTLSNVAVIGAGAAGLTAALELSRAGRRVHVFEAHKVPGGCASWFRRSTPHGSLQFDAGATVLDGLVPGDFLAGLLRRHGVQTAPFQRMPKIFFKLRADERPFALACSDIKAWLADLERAFPSDLAFIEHDFSRLARLAVSTRRIIERVPSFPFERPSDLLRNRRLLGEVPRAALDLVSCGSLDFGEWLESRAPSERLREWIDMNLLITTQTEASRVYTPWAALALNFYPLGAGTLPSGMRGLMEPLLRRLLECEGSRLSLRSRVIGVEKSDEGFWLRVKRAGDDLETREGPFAAVFSTLPRFNSELLAPRETFAPRDDWATNAPDLWGASAAYVALTDDSSWPDEAFNVHSKLSAGPGPDGNDAYLSFSARGDETRAPNGLRVATLSTHVRLQGWDRENARDYSERKTALGSKLLEHVEAWSRTPRAKFHHTEFAAPPSFERYTGRRAGNVGGLPMTHENTIRSPRSQRTRLAGFYQIGDTSFPGQSVLACALGAVIATEKFLSDFG